MTRKETPKLKAPFPYFGGKSRVAHIVWERFGDVWRYVEPFCGSAAVLLNRPEHHQKKSELINDINGHICNVWRAIQRQPGAVVEELELLGARCELTLRAANNEARAVYENLSELLESDVEVCNPVLAARWIWGASSCIGREWVNVRKTSMPSMGYVPAGIIGTGVHHRGFYSDKRAVVDALSERMKRVNILCGSWQRTIRSKTLRGSPEKKNKVGIFFDPPYLTPSSKVYTNDSFTLAKDVREWCEKHGGEAQLRIALCGYDEEHASLEKIGWTRYEWFANGYSKKRTGTRCERVWFSPHCLPP